MYLHFFTSLLKFLRDLHRKRKRGEPSLFLKLVDAYDNANMCNKIQLQTVATELSFQDFCQIVRNK